MREFGTVKIYDPVRGFGFITRSEGQDVFVSYKEFEDATDAVVVPGITLSFIVKKTSRGLRATSVAIVG